MAREAREKALYSTYYIKQQCPRVKIFGNKENRLIFIETLQSVKGKYDFKLYGMALNESGYELVLYDNGSDISRIMKSINISFSMKFKCKNEGCDQLFKERYKSEILDTKNIQETILNLPLCLYADQSLLDTYLLNDEPIKDCLDCKAKAKQKLDELIKLEGLSFDEMLKNKKFRNELIKDFRKKSILSLKELGELFGGLSESAISKILTR